MDVIVTLVEVALRAVVTLSEVMLEVALVKIVLIEEALAEVAFANVAVADIALELVELHTTLVTGLAKVASPDMSCSASVKSYIMN